MLSRKSQLSIVNIIFFVILVAVSVVVTPVMASFLTTMEASYNFSATTSTILDLIIPMFWLGVAITFFLYVVPIRPQQY